MVVAYDIEGEKIQYNPSIARRNEGKAILILTDERPGITYHLYLAFIDDERKQKSNSMYLGSLTIGGATRQA
jgi:hypothetical protein